jgi:cobalt/nickel transport protein
MICQLSFVVLLLAVATSSADGHYHMLLPEQPAVEKGANLQVRFQWGHPFEHQLFDASPPQALVVLTPDGAKADLTNELTEVKTPAAQGKSVRAFQVPYKPTQRGDHVFLLRAAPVWMEEEQEFFEDTVKVVLHVQAQKGWDARVGEGFEMLPLTRPYGLQAGMVFQAQALVVGKPLAGALVEIERYNPEPPKELPADEHITRTAKTDPNGIVTCTLVEPGWWCITAQRDGGKKERGGKDYPVKQRSTLWVWVDAKR